MEGTAANSRTFWKVDVDHSEVFFKVKYFVISTISGCFEEFDTQLVSEGEGFHNVNIWFTANTSSVYTGVVDRDNYLKSEDFFHSSQYPQLIFESQGACIREGRNELEGNLTIRGLTLPVILKVYFGGLFTDQLGRAKAAFKVSCTINRQDFGLTWNSITKEGRALVSDEVEVVGSILFNRQ